MDKVRVVIGKEWSEVFRNRLVLFSVAFLPVLFTAMPLLILNGMGSSVDIGSEIPFDGPEQFTTVCENLTGGECMQYFLASQFLILYLILPIMIPVTIASYSIVGEKTTRTLEPVLATPITNLELLAGKALSAVIPALIATWGGFAIFVVGLVLLDVSPAVLNQLLSPVWLGAVFIIGGLLSISAVSLAVMVSSRVSDPRAAEQISALVVLPVVAIFVGQIIGLFYINEQIIFWMALGLGAVDIALVYIATQLFQRETILTRWK
ncbi:MAG TPA: ABC transporter permease subunit [Anaerolineales bacterium]|nr:ABC transporter permease subunit [Anaerolineales bacterium]